jgi:hypothetical protein
MPMLMFHDDTCDELLDAEGRCPKCGIQPDMQSTGFKEIKQAEIYRRLAKGQTMLGSQRVPVSSNERVIRIAK